MKETCSCGPSATARTRQAVLDAEDRWALRCPGCGRLDRALPFRGGVLILRPNEARPGQNGKKRPVPA